MADQNQNICVRRERGVCKVCWSPTAMGDFSISGETKKDMPSMEKGFNQPSVCCNYGMDGMKTSGYDCVTLPGAIKCTMEMKAVQERLCGRQFIDATTKTTAMVSTTVCCKFINPNFRAFDILFSWCSGYHIRLTRGRSPVRSRAKTK